MKYITKYWKLVIVLIVVLVLVVRISNRFFKDEPVEVTTSSPVVELYSLADISGGDLELSCQVEPITDVEVTPQISGTVTEVNVSDGDVVQAGDTLFTIENIQQRIAVTNARVSLQSAELSLQDLVDQNDPDKESSLVAQTQTQQNTLIETTRNALFNTDLRAYPLDDPEDITKPSPTVSGNYNCDQEGVYNVDVYSSGSKSGASLRYSGLEEGTIAVSTGDFGSFLGSCGLELVFEEGFKKNEDWVIPVPNTRSSEYFAAVKAYENALASKDVTLNQATASFEQIQQQRGRVQQARLQYQLALDNLDKTIIKATAGGTLSSFNVDAGDYVNALGPVGVISSVNLLELVTYIGAEDQGFISPGAHVDVQGTTTKITSVVQALDDATRKSKVTIAIPDGIDLNEGISTPCVIERTVDVSISEDGGVVVPLSALSVIGVDTFVFTVDEQQSAKSIPVVTGAILGDEIVVYGLETGNIIHDARGIRNEQPVSIKNK